MATRRELPADVAAAFDRVPEAGDRFASLPPERQQEWLDWIDRGRGGRGRAGRIDEMTRRLLPGATEEEVVEQVAPPPNRWWLWLLLLLLLVIVGLLVWWLLARGDDKTTSPERDRLAFRSRSAVDQGQGSRAQHRPGPEQDGPRTSFSPSSPARARNSRTARPWSSRFRVVGLRFPT